MEKSWKITLSDGTTIENLRLNGNNFVSETEIKKEMFDGKLLKVTIEGIEDGKKIVNEYKNMELVQIVHYEDGYYFVLRELSQEEINMAKIQGNIEYLAMMTDVDLEV